MKANYKFSNLCGTVYTQGNVLFTPDGNSLVSPVGNRVSVFDLVNNKSRTLPFENRKNITAIALSPDARLLLSVDADGRALLTSFPSGTTLHQSSFHSPVLHASFSPKSTYLSITHSHQTQIWRTPNPLIRSFAPFELVRTYTGHRDDVVSVTWSKCESGFITTSRDMTAILYTMGKEVVDGFRPVHFAGHRDMVVGAYFSDDGQLIYTVSRDGALFVWSSKDSPSSDSDSDSEMSTVGPTSRYSFPRIARTRWGISSRHYFSIPHTSLLSSSFHPSTSLLICGFSNGTFTLSHLSPAFTPLQTLSISSSSISSLAVSTSGEWLGFGLGRGVGDEGGGGGGLLVWEWQSESFILKMQGHSGGEMSCLAWSNDGQILATGGDDGKIKLWSVRSGYNFVTFSEHTAPISSLQFSVRGVLFSSSLDGTARAYDLTRYRNFRTFTSPSPAQFACLAIDPSGEVIACGSTDTFEIYLWSVQTGKLLDILAGHEGPVCTLAFSPSGANQLASGSWDRTVRLWNVFGRSRTNEPFTLNSDVLCVSFRPDGQQLAVSTLDGSISFFDVGFAGDQGGKQVLSIDGRKDLSGGRKAGDRISAKNSAAGKAFTSLSWSGDGGCVLAGGRSKYVVIYDVRDPQGLGGVLVKKSSITQNLSLDGTEEFLDSRRVNEAGINIDTIDDVDDEAELDERLDKSLPGAQRGAGDLGKRKWRKEARTRQVSFSPTGRAWAAASTEGLLIYSMDETVSFDPMDLTIDLTPQSVLQTLGKGEYLKALLMAFRLSELPLVRHVYEHVPREDIRLVCRQLPEKYLAQALRFVAQHLAQGPHLEFDLLWASGLLGVHGRYLRDRSAEYAGAFRELQKALVDVEGCVGKLCDENTSTLDFLMDQARLRKVDVEMV